MPTFDSNDIIICNVYYMTLFFTLHTGYSALFRHPNDVLNYCVYIIPGNPKVTNDDLSYWHDHLMKEDPNISRALGKGAKMERMKAGGIYTGCWYKVNTYPA